VNPGDARTSVRIRLLNTGDVANAVFPTPGGVVDYDYDGDAAIDGVPGTAAAVELQTGVGGTGKAVLPTGAVTDEVAGHRVTLVDNGMPVVLLRAEEFGVDGTESPADLEAREDLKQAVEQVRLAAGPLFGLGDVSEQTVPKMFLLSTPRDGGAISTRGFIPKRVHTSIGVLMAASVAAGIRIPGAVGADLARIPGGDTVPIEHPGGVFPAIVRVAEDAGTWRATYSANIRTARKLFDGVVFPRPRL
jgi:4-oxalomesaconate tautomerase